MRFRRTVLLVGNRTGVSKSNRINLHAASFRRISGRCMRRSGLRAMACSNFDSPAKASVAAIIVGTGATFLARRRSYILLSSFMTITLLAGVGLATGWSLSSPPHWIQGKNPVEKILYATARADGIMRRTTVWEDFARTDIAAIQAFGQTMLSVFTNGSHAGTAPATISTTQESGLTGRHTPLASLPLLIKNPQSVLVINSTTGFERALAASAGATHIRSLGREGREARHALAGKAAGEFPGATRRVLQQEGQSYDLIYLLIPSPPLPGWSERSPVANHFYTKEAFQDYWRYLKPHGILAIAAFEETLYVRALLTAWEVLSEDPMSENTYLTPQAWGFRQIPKSTPWNQSQYLLALSKGIADPASTTRVADLASNLGLVTLFGPAITPPTTFNIQENPYYVLYHPGGLDPARKALQDYMGWVIRAPLDMTAATDRRPFFFQDIRDLHPYFKALVLLCLSVVAAVFFLCCPAYRRPDDRGSLPLPLPIFLSYFLCLGVGTALAMVAVIYQGTLITLSFDLSVAVVLVAMLCGVSASAILFWRGVFGRSPHYFSIGIALLVLGWTAWTIQNGTLISHKSSPVRTVLLAVMTAPIGLLSANLMRLGSNRFSEVVQGLLPWTWVTLGLGLLLGSVIAFWVAQLHGWPITWALSLGCYMLTAASILVLPRYKKALPPAVLTKRPKRRTKARAQVARK